MSNALASTATSSKYTIIGEDVAEEIIFEPADVIKRLLGTPRQISSIYYYDDRGSVLFEELCLEPSYYLTRTEQKILETFAPEIAEVVGASVVAELGCGNGTKSKHLLNAFADKHGDITYIPIDINRSILAKNAEMLLDEMASVTIRGIVGTYPIGLSHVAGIRQAKCLMFLGSTIGNMEDEEIAALLTLATAAMNVGDHFLVGIDLDKDSAIVEAAYNNQTAVLTNLSVLQHLNWRFDGNFDIFCFRHVAFHNTEARRIESYLESTVTQQVRLAALKLSLEIRKGERIRTEISRKFVEHEFLNIFRAHGLQPLRCWHDRDRYCALHLFVKPG